MSGLDLFVDGFPHGTPEGYDQGCQGGTCPAGVEYGLSCKIAKAKSRGDYQYQKLAKAGTSIPEIADALGLVGTAPAPVKKTATKKPTPTPATVQGGVSLADAAEQIKKVASVGSERSRKIWEETAANMGIAENDVASAVDAAEAIAESAPAPASDSATETDSAPEAEDEKPKRVWERKRGEEKKGPTPQATDAPAGAEAPATPKPSEIREWARQRGYEVGAKGKLPQHIVDHYWEATGRLDSPTRPKATAAPADPAAESNPDPAPAVETPTPVAVAPVEKPERPEWGDVAAAVDVEAARALAVRLEQELALAEQQRDEARNEADTLAKDYLDEFTKRSELEERLQRRTEERDTAERLKRIAERASTLLLTKWGEERDANEAAHALIVQQAHTINQLTDMLPPKEYSASLAAIFDTGTYDEPTPAAASSTETRRPWRRR